MPRNKGNWNAYFKRNDSKNIKRRKRSGEEIKERKKPYGSIGISGLSLPRVVGESTWIDLPPPVSKIRQFAKSNRSQPTPAERELDRILRDLNGGVLRGRYNRQHPISGKWIVDFFFREVRLAIEVDGGYHNHPAQQQKDREKEFDCQRFDITLLRVTNADVFGDREALVAKLRVGWRQAIRRPNQIIGKQTPWRQ